MGQGFAVRCPGLEIAPDGTITGTLDGFLSGAGVAEVTGTADPSTIVIEYSIPAMSVMGTLTLNHQ